MNISKFVIYFFIRIRISNYKHSSILVHQYSFENFKIKKKILYLISLCISFNINSTICKLSFCWSICNFFAFWQYYCLPTAFIAANNINKNFIFPKEKIANYILDSFKKGSRFDNNYVYVYIVLCQCSLLVYKFVDLQKNRLFLFMKLFLFPEESLFSKLVDIVKLLIEIIYCSAELIPGCSKMFRSEEVLIFVSEIETLLQY